jgi:hypothetical protein
MGKGSFFLMLALLSFGAGLTIILLRRPLRAVLND